MSDKRERIIEIIKTLPDEALEELEEFVIDVREFYEVRASYNPPPLPEPEEITLRFDDEPDP